MCATRRATCRRRASARPLVAAGGSRGARLTLGGGQLRLELGDLAASLAQPGRQSDDHTAIVWTWLRRGGRGRLLLTRAQVLDPRTQLRVAVEEIDRHAGGRGDRAEVDLFARLDLLAQRGLGPLGRRLVLGLRRLAQRLGTALSAHPTAPRPRR